jgi:hypothetical protein
MRRSSDALRQFSVPVNENPAIDGNRFFLPQGVGHGTLNSCSPLFLSDIL